MAFTDFLNNILTGDKPTGAEAVLSGTPFGQAIRSVRGGARNIRETLSPEGDVLGATTTRGQGTPGGGGGGTGGGGASDFTPVNFRGDTFNDITSLTNALNRAAREQFDDNTKEIKRQFESGLLSFDDKEALIAQNRKDIGKQRDAAFQDVSGFFSSISPQAFQSGQTALEGDITQEFQTGQSELGRQETRLGEARDEFEREKDKALKAEDDFLQEQRDRFANQKFAFQERQSGSLPGGAGGVDIDPIELAQRNLLNQLGVGAGGQAGTPAGSRRPAPGSGSGSIQDFLNDLIGR